MTVEHVNLAIPLQRKQGAHEGAKAPLQLHKTVSPVTALKNLTLGSRTLFFVLARKTSHDVL